MKYLLFFSILFIKIQIFAASSKLWGKSGEKWTTTSRLPDFSYAGYHRGKKEIPLVTTDNIKNNDYKSKKIINIKDEGAVGDGISDDTKVFKRVIENNKDTIIYIPEGKYIIKKKITIKKKGIILKGDGKNKSILFFPIPLNTLKPAPTRNSGGRKTTLYSWSGGLITVQGHFNYKNKTKIIKEAKRGDFQITVSENHKFTTGELIEISLKNNKSYSLIKHLYSNDSGDTEKISKSAKVLFFAKIIAIDNNIITLDKPLRFDIKLDWQPHLSDVSQKVSEIGIQDLAFHFPKTEYKGHFTEQGFNAITYRNVSNCWISNVKILNADSAIFIHQCSFCTLSKITIASQRNSKDKMITGHHGILVQGWDNLIEEFIFNTKFYHDLTVTKFSSGNVFSKGLGIDLCFDHHKQASYENLLVETDIGKGSRLFSSGGGKQLGKHSGARTTFWNITSKNDINYPKKFGPWSINFIGIKSKQNSIIRPRGQWFEKIFPLSIRPTNIYESQKEHQKTNIIDKIPK